MYTRNERGVRQGDQPPQTYGESAASGPAPGTAGPHRHDILNKLDPRVDSTHDRQPAATTSSGIPEGTYGPHRSRIANALDPRVDSDLDSTRAGAGTGPGGGMGGSAAVPPMAHSQAVGGSHVPEGMYYGPQHTSRMANALDPRVDSDRDRHVRRGTAGVAPAPAVGGGIDATNMPAGTSSTTSAGTGISAPKTSGPHRSDLMNKLDPRVDSKTGAYR
jgi:hypothetical protein